MHANKIHIKNQVYNYYSDNLVKAIKLETKIFFINEKHKDLVIYFTRYVHSKSIKTSSLHIMN